MLMVFEIIDYWDYENTYNIYEDIAFYQFFLTLKIGAGYE